MVSTFTPNKRIEQPDHNDYVDSWDMPVNADWAIIDLAFGGAVTINLTGLGAVTNRFLTPTECQPLKITATGAPTAQINLVVPAGVGGLWLVRNDCTGASNTAIFMLSAFDGTWVNIPPGHNTLVSCDASGHMVYADNTPGSAAGSTTQLQYNNGGLLAGASGVTWDGTTLATTGLTVTGSTVLGDTAGDTLTINGTALSAPNGLNVNLTQLRIAAAPYNQVMINATAPYGSSALTVGGVITSTAGGYYFPDGTNQTSATSIPPGTIVAYAGGTEPPGWFFCAGQGLSTTTYVNLFNVIGYYYGGGGGVFLLPDTRGRVIAHPDSGTGNLTDFVDGFGQNAYLGVKGGLQYHTLAERQMPSHTHTVNSHAHVGPGISFAYVNGGIEAGRLGGDTNYPWVGYTANNDTGGYFGAAPATDAKGSTNAHNNVQPTIILNYIIKV